jgi:hypothetical protein
MPGSCVRSLRAFFTRPARLISGVYFKVMKLRRRGRLASSPVRGSRTRFLVLGLCVLLSRNVLAFDRSLQPEEIQEAYSLGQSNNHEELADFLKQYQHDFSYPSDNPVAYVQSVEFQTPYEQIVLRTLRTTRYTKFQADEDYQSNRGIVMVRVVVALKSRYSGSPPLADSYRVIVSQAKSIEPRVVKSTVTCDPYSYDSPTFGNCIAYTREILLRFDADQFAPGATTVKVMLPFDRSLETKYNLNKLK